MRILTWNINGARTLPQYHPWYTLKTFEAMLECPDIKADIVCFQEMKIARALIDRPIALPGAYDAYFSLPKAKGKGGYSGVAIYTDSRTVAPLKAEEGLSGLLQPKPPLSPIERVSPSYPSAHHLDLMADETDHVPSDLMELDLEGRALVLDFGLFVLLNLYCPAETVATRLPYKMNFHHMLKERVRKLTEEEHREVIVIGDINITALPIDHCDGKLESKRSEWWEHPARTWFRDWLEPAGKLVDVTRRFWPGREGMFTCWNTLISARASNYGTRIDYILCTPGLIPWLKHSDILPAVQGSDHCPVYLDLHDEISMPDGSVRSLQEEMQFKGPGIREAPRIAAKYWDEFSNRQPLLSTFFGKKASETIGQGALSVEQEGILQDVGVSLTGSTAEISGSPPIDTPPLSHPLSTTSCTSDSAEMTPPQTQSAPSQSMSLSQPVTPASHPLSAPKRPLAGPSRSRPTPPSEPKTKSAPKKGQMKLSSFFGSSAPQASSEKVTSHKGKQKALSQSSPAQPISQNDIENEAEEEKYWIEALSQPSPSETSKAAWSELLAPIRAPNCSFHGEPSKEWTVNKPGPNKGKRFYLCSRPVGPGYDAGKAKRLREEVNPQYRCDFFQWASDVKKTTSRQSVGEPSAKRPRN